MVLDRFAVFVAGRDLAAVSEQVCLDFLAEQTGVRLMSLSDPVVGEKAVQAVRRPLVLVADALAGRAVEAGRLVVPPHDGCPARFRAVRDEYLVSCRARGNAEALLGETPPLRRVGQPQLCAIGRCLFALTVADRTTRTYGRRQSQVLATGAVLEGAYAPGAIPLGRVQVAESVALCPIRAPAGSARGSGAGQGMFADGL
jgi:hypothetical protein